MSDAPDPAASVSQPRRRRRWVLIVVLGMVAVAGALFVREFYFSHPVGSGPAGPDVDPSGFAKPWTNRPVLVLGLGDSITAGLGAKTRARAFFNRLVTAPPDEFADMRNVNLSSVMPQLTAQNLAVSGTNSLQHREVIETDLPVQDAQVLGLVVMTTGGNDLIHWYGRTPPKEGAMYGATLEQAEPWIAAFEQRLGTTLDLIAQRFPGGCHIFLGDIYDPTDGVGDAPSRDCRLGLTDWPSTPATTRSCGGQPKAGLLCTWCRCTRLFSGTVFTADSSGASTIELMTRPIGITATSRIRTIADMMPCGVRFCSRSSAFPRNSIRRNANRQSNRPPRRMLPDPPGSRHHHHHPRSFRRLLPARFPFSPVPSFAGSSAAGSVIVAVAKQVAEAPDPKSVLISIRRDNGPGVAPAVNFSGILCNCQRLVGGLKLEIGSPRINSQDSKRLRALHQEFPVNLLARFQHPEEQSRGDLQW